MIAVLAVYFGSQLVTLALVWAVHRRR